MQHHRCTGFGCVFKCMIAKIVNDCGAERVMGWAVVACLCAKALRVAGNYYRQPDLLRGALVNG